MIATAFGPLIGGIATPAGTAANLVAIAQLKQLAGIDISFCDVDGLRGAGGHRSWCRSRGGLLLWLFPPEIDRAAVHASTRSATAWRSSVR